MNNIRPPNLSFQGYVQKIETRSVLLPTDRDCGTARTAERLSPREEHRRQEDGRVDNAEMSTATYTASKKHDKYNIVLFDSHNVYHE